MIIFYKYDIIYNKIIKNCSINVWDYKLYFLIWFFIYLILCLKVFVVINYNEVLYKIWFCVWLWKLRFFIFDKLFSLEVLFKLNLEVR